MREAVCIGVDLGGTNLRCAVVSAAGAVLARASRPTAIGAGRDRFLASLLELLDRVVKEACERDCMVAAVGLGIPGLVSAEGVIVSSVNLLPLEGSNLAEAVCSGLGLPVTTVNDANASALGEHRFGAGRASRSSLTVTIGTGVGGGLILDGRLWTGVDGVAGEFGHLTVEPQGRPCGCGNRGCLEQYASAEAIAARAAELGLEAKDAAALAVCARKGEPAALAIFEEAGRRLGQAAAGVVNLLNLEAIIVGGGVAGSFDLFAPAMRAEMLSRCFAIPGGRARIVKGELGADAGVLGAAAIAFDASGGAVADSPSPASLLAP